MLWRNVTFLKILQFFLKLFLLFVMTSLIIKGSNLLAHFHLQDVKKTSVSLKLRVSLILNGQNFKDGKWKSQALPVFHAQTGCDTTSSFKGKGKKSAWQVWQAYEEATETLEHLASQPFQQLDARCDHFKKIERLIVVLCDRTSPITSVKETRKDLFCRKSLSVERIPPTQNALLQHVQRAVYQAGIWTTCTQAQPVVPSPQCFWLDQRVDFMDSSMDYNTWSIQSM